MMEQPLAILQKIPNDENVKNQYDQHRFRKLMDELVHLDGYEKRGLPDRQPSYQGRPLAYWLCLKNNDDDDAVRDEPHFEEAIRAMGTNCLPYLLKWIAYELPAWKSKLIDFLF